ncbi:hypothetical protein L1049_025792 [Liquidambar formosana]|uniref:Transposase-associated domain-containing protein n=1 Tax=Liquidambar formosana TaxID=63359 RepID=A0AAP0NDR7_LIQFO
MADGNGEVIPSVRVYVTGPNGYFLPYMDKTWMHLNKLSPEYEQGIKDFMNFARSTVDRANKMRCPCCRCKNVYYRIVDEVEDHVFVNGINPKYTRWIHHGEDFEPIIHDDANDNDDMADNVDDYVDEVQEILEDLYGGTFMDSYGREPSTDHDPYCTEGEADKFARLLRNAQRELYPGCEKFSKLSFLVKLLHIKIINHWSNKSLNMLLKLLKEALPIGETLPKTHYEAKSVMRDFGLGYTAIHACQHDCVLFWKEHEYKDKCPECGESRWKYNDGKRKKIPHKILRYFPLKPRLQRLFMSKKTATDMRWHKEKRIAEENVLRYPTDSIAWKEFDKEHDWFAQEPRNVRLGLASDGFNPFGNMSNSYSMWPVLLMPYNLPPWKCMKEPFFMMSLLIPGPKSPGNDIDVYMRPFIDELKELWEDGVETYDASTKQNFQLHAADKFEIDLYRPNVKHTVDMMLKDRHKNWRHKLYKFYKEFPPEEASQHLPEDVKQNDWDHLCERFSSDKFQVQLYSVKLYIYAFWLLH